MEDHPRHDLNFIKLRIIRFLKDSRYGRSTYEIEDQLKEPLYLIRKALRELKQERKADWYAVWYGCNAGYKRVYRLLDKYGTII